MSGVGKGVAASSIGKILQARGYSVTAIKIDPYVNVDAGTMNPTEHGEVFVTEDGDETDQDIGNYERFLNVDIMRDNYMTTGRVYQSVIQKERNLDYNGQCVEVVPHIPQEVIRRIKKASAKAKADFTIIEIGGTVGEYQNILFLEAARMMKNETPDMVKVVMVSYLPIPLNVGEMKTKPTQYAVRTLNSAGIQPDFLLCRAEQPLDKKRKEKLHIFCSIPVDHVISAPDVDSIYQIPINFEKEKLSLKLLDEFKLKARKKNLEDWRAMARRAAIQKPEVAIGVVGKYFATGDFTLSDSYISVIEAVKHAAADNKVKANLVWLDAEEIEKKGTGVLKDLDGIIIPQGWGSRGSEGKIKAIKYAREKKVPYFGLCYGMQMAVIEFARNVAKMKGANSEEINAKIAYPVIHIMPEQQELLKQKQYGGTIRLGAWPCKLKKGSRIQEIYNKTRVSERHRHRYEVNNKFRSRLEKKGLVIAGTSPDNQLVEAIEISDHPFFIGTQFHPEYKSRPLAPHPLFVEFIKVCLATKL